MSSRLQSKLWSKEELAQRATRWAELRGWSRVTVASLIKWKQEGLIPRPTVRSLGQGRGSVSGWAWPAYRRLLRLLTHRQRSRRWRDLRIALWLEGYDVDVRRLRADLADFYRDLVLSVNDELGTDNWDVVEDAAPTPTAVRAIAKRFLTPDALEGWIRQLKLDPVAEPAVRMALSMLMTPQGQRAGIAFIHQFVATGAGDIPAAISDLRAGLPPSLAVALDGDEKEWAAHAGLLAHPDGFENPLLLGIEEATDQTLINLREAAWQADRAWCACMRFGTALLEVRPEILGAFRLMTPLATHLTRTMSARSPFRSPEARVVLMGFAVVSESTRRDEGRRLAAGLRIVSQLAGWLADHRELLSGIESYSEHQWAALMQAPDFPGEARQTLTAAWGRERSEALSSQGVLAKQGADCYCK